MKIKLNDWNEFQSNLKEMQFAFLSYYYYYYYYFAIEYFFKKIFMGAI